MATNSKYTEDWVPVKGITNGTIVLNRGQEKVTGVKIQPRNIFILDYETQQSIIYDCERYVVNKKRSISWRGSYRYARH